MKISESQRKNLLEEYKMKMIRSGREGGTEQDLMDCITIRESLGLSTRQIKKEVGLWY